MENYQKIYEGSMIEAQPLLEMLIDHRINPIIKDETESARLAGFAPLVIGELQVYVHNDELGVAKYVLASLTSPMNTLKAS